jgi:hypothetical protein
MQRNVKSKKKGASRARGVGTIKPPQLSANIVLSHVFRFRSTSGSPVSVTGAQILRSTGMIAGTAILGYPIASSFRLSRVRVWTPPASQGASATVALLWINSAGTTAYANKEVSDTTVSVSHPAYIDATPPRGTLNGFWRVADDNNVFTLTAPVGSIIDMHVSVLLGDGPQTAATGSVVLTGATAGYMYYAALDGVGGVYEPVSLTEAP